MRIHHFLAPPRFGRFVCYPESFGHYAGDSSHSEHRLAGQMAAYNLHIVRSGRGVVQKGDRLEALEAGSGFLFGPGLEQRYYADEADPWDVRWVHFTGPAAAELLGEKGRAEPWLFSWREAERVDRIWDEMLALGVPALHGTDEARLSAQLYELVAVLALLGGNERSEPAAGGRNRILGAAEWIRAHSAEPLTLPRMAAEAGYSISHFSRQFAALLGRTPIEFLTECRIVHAKALLASTDRSVKAVAEQVGFASSAYFIHRFHRAEKVTPEQFRRAMGR
ncbi:AraC family transcriptional regulator [Gorillibacterium sp. sgz500922]|uniref:helix-turn-helix transcriptional regulator n=1 Tax=Gorillibacterium sp. sgz500922 TaxID=3446694 RepID=UPI003F66B49B